MAPSPPALPTNRALLVQVRAQPPETPMAWEGRVEHVVSGPGTHVQTLAALLAFMRRVLTDEQAQAAAP